MTILGVVELSTFKVNIFIECICFLGLLFFIILSLGLSLFPMNYLFLLICCELLTLVSILLLLNIGVIFKDPFVQTALLLLLCVNATEIAIILSILVLFFNLVRLAPLPAASPLIVRGALTSRRHSFSKREWEVKHLQVLNFFDSTLSPLVLEVKGTQVERILPLKGVATTFILDKVRFSFDGFNERARLFGFFWRRFGAWRASSSAQFQNLTNFFLSIFTPFYLASVLKSLLTGGMVWLAPRWLRAPICLQLCGAQLLSIEQLVALKFFRYALGWASPLNSLKGKGYLLAGDVTPQQSDLLNPFFFDGASPTWADTALMVKKTFLLVNLELRFSLPSLNLFFRQRLQSGVCSANGVLSFFAFGFSLFGNFPTFHLGFSLATLRHLLRSTHYISGKGPFAVLVSAESAAFVRAALRAHLTELAFAGTAFKVITTYNTPRLNRWVVGGINLSESPFFGNLFNPFSVIYTFFQFLPTNLHAPCVQGREAFTFLFVSHLFKPFFDADFLIPRPSLFEEAMATFTLFGQAVQSPTTLVRDVNVTNGWLAPFLMGFNFRSLYFFKLLSFCDRIDLATLAMFNAVRPQWQRWCSLPFFVVNVGAYTTNFYQEGPSLALFASRALSAAFSAVALRRLGFRSLFESTIQWRKPVL